MKRINRSYTGRARAMGLAAVQARALMPNSAMQIARADYVRRRALRRRVFNRWRTVTARRSIRSNAMGRSIVRLAMARRRYRR